MSAGTSEFFCLICFLVCSCSAQTNITAKLGQEVILPCKVPDNIANKNIRAVQWSRPDQDPDYVLFYRDGHFDPVSQHPSYQNRVDLQDKDMKNGDFSLILKRVKMEDTGTYECHVFEEGNNDPISITYLEVLLSAQTNITAKLGQEVVLPCKVPKKNNNIITITAVEWIRPDLDPGYVLFYRDGRFDPDNQHPSYQNRVDLQDKEMKDGDVSLVLKDVMNEDIGTYECRVYQRLEFEPINIINLEVHQSGKLDENSGDGGDKTGIIVGSVVGVILLLAVASVGFLTLRNHRRQNPNLPVPPDEAAAEQML